jgi:hypothetical protein
VRDDRTCQDRRSLTLPRLLQLRRTFVRHDPGGFGARPTIFPPRRIAAKYRYRDSAIIGASSSAFADPQPTDRQYDRDRCDERRFIRGHDYYPRYEGSRWRDWRGRWVPLAQHYSADARRQFINLRGRGEFRFLRIQAERGAPVINQVAIQYVDGNTQKVRLDARLPRGAGEVIRLNRHPFNRSCTEPGYGAYSVSPARRHP